MADRLKFVLALPAVGTTGKQRRSSSPTMVATKEVDKGGHIVAITVLAGEDIKETILSFIKDESLEHAKGKDILTIVEGASGTIIRPVLEVAGSEVPITSTEDVFSIVALQGSFILDREGLAQATGSLALTCVDSDSQIVGGTVNGKLIAASSTQVLLLIHSVGGEEKEAADEKAG